MYRLAPVIAAVVVSTADADETTRRALGQQLQIKPSEISVSGVSAGGFMALQLQVAHSKNMKGAALIAAGPYHCSQGDVDTALHKCSAFLTQQTISNCKIMFSGLGLLPKDTQHRQVKYVNNRLECDHGKLKRLIQPTVGFQSMKTVYATIKGFKVMRMFKYSPRGSTRSAWEPRRDPTGFLQWSRPGSSILMP